MPHAQCPMPHPPSPMPHAQCPITNDHENPKDFKYFDTAYRRDRSDFYESLDRQAGLLLASSPSSGRIPTN
ncbi:MULTISPECIES: hypothetical protein [unclassified Nostoc]|uniref:hypothetical protein n=1 Tax=unclassified Nostoc TaxID=2593658 RepID=UPI002610CEC7|nr:hypothetical protein [Nostoc sp. S13]